MRLLTALLPAALLVAALAGCDLDVPVLGGPSDASAVPIRARALGRYLAEVEMDVPEVVSAATGHLHRGKVYRERVRDQRGRWTLTTIWMDPEQPRLLQIRLKRDMVCPDCDGTGTRESAIDVGLTFMCRTCDGSGVLENQVIPRRYILSDADLEAGAELPGTYAATERLKERPPTAAEQRRIDQLISDDPRERLAALRWLEANYLREGHFFHEYMPMLRKARRIETDPDNRITVYQFWAGKEAVPDQAYYRVYVDARSGRVEETGFVNEYGEGEAAAEGEENIVSEKVDSVREFFRWRK